MDKKYYDRLCVIDDYYKDLSPEKVAELVETGRKLIELHGDEGLHWKLKTEEEFRAAGTYFDYRTVTNEEYYK